MKRNVCAAAPHQSLLADLLCHCKSDQPPRKKPFWVISKMKAGSSIWSHASSICMNNRSVFVKAKLNSKLRFWCQDLSSIFTVLCNKNDNNLWVRYQRDAKRLWRVTLQPGWIPAWLNIVAALGWSYWLHVGRRTLAFDRRIYNYSDCNDWAAAAAKRWCWVHSVWCWKQRHLNVSGNMLSPHSSTVSICNINGGELNNKMQLYYCEMIQMSSIFLNLVRESWCWWRTERQEYLSGGRVTPMCHNELQLLRHFGCHEFFK